MRCPRRSLGWSVALASTLAIYACKKDEASDAGSTPPSGPTQPEDAPTAKPKPVALPDEGPLPTLRTGMLEPERRESVAAELVADGVDGARFVELRLPSTGQDVEEPMRVHVQSPAGAVAIVDRSASDRTILVRVPDASGGPVASIEGTVFIAADRAEGRRWIAQPFTATGASKSRRPELPRRWAEAFAAELRGDSNPWWLRTATHPWREFAAGRVLAVMAGHGPGGTVDTTFDARPRRTELSELMHTTTAATSMQEALQHDRGLRLRVNDGPATVPIAELAPPGLVDHPWAEMIAALPDAGAAVAEPLAAATPAEFWYVRFDDIRVLLQVLDEAGAWITPVAHIMEERAEVRDLSARYQAQLGLRRTGLAKKLGHTVVERLAIMGSDPYLREGSDVTFVFELKNHTVFDTELARHLDEYRAEVPGIVESTLTHGTHTITVQRDPTGTVRQHRATVDDYAVVSNSEGAIRAVLDAIDGKRRRLSEQQDLAYMLARDPGAHEGFAFFGDTFIANVVGPQQKVLAARRQQALAELLTPGYAALLYGWLEGKAPADTEALVASGLLDRDELRHRSGEAIEFQPGATARSSWGSPSALTPLLDLPAPTMVTEAERDAYGTFKEGYQQYWRQFIDPIAVRMDLEEHDGITEAVIDVRVLPLIEGTEYGDLEEIVGTERIEVPAIDDGLQMVWAVGAESDLRRELDRTASSLTGRKDVGIGWLGDWVMLGTLDRRALVDLVALTDEDIQLPLTVKPERHAEELALAKRVGQLPVYAAAHVRNPTALVATLTALRGMVNEVAPGMVEWGEHSRHRDYPIVRVGVDPKSPGEFRDFAEAIALYYVQAGDALIFALDPKVLHALIDRVVDGGGPKRGIEGGPQFVVDARMAEGRASWTAVAWALQGQANRTQHASRAAAEILLRGDPSITTPEQLVSRGIAYFGTYPVSASGRSDFTLSPHGAGDAVHGTEIAPAYPELPVEQSPIAGLMERMTGLQASVAFDREPAKLATPARSLHTRLRVHLGGEAP